MCDNEDNVKRPVNEEGGGELPGAAPEQPEEQLPAVQHPLPLLHPPLPPHLEEAQLRALGRQGLGG